MQNTPPQAPAALDNFELAALLLACAAQIVVLVMTLRDLPHGGAAAQAAATADYTVIERP